MKKIAVLFLALTSQFAIAEEMDTRRVVELSEANRHHVLSEMRALLAGTQNIVTALAKNDMKAVEESARPLGMGMANNAENTLHDALPKDFMMLGKSVHKAFDEIALDAQTLKDPKHTLQQLSQAMAQCSACHASYQIRTAN